MEYQYTKTIKPVAEVLPENHSDTRVPLVKNLMCPAFKEYEEVPKTATLHFTEDGVTWVTSNISGVAGALGVEVIDLRNELTHTQIK